MTNTDTHVLDLAAAIGSRDSAFDTLLVDLQRQCEAPRGRHETLTVDCGSGPEEMTAGRALTNLVLCRPYRLAGVAPGSDRFVRGQLDAGALERHMNGTVRDLCRRMDPKRLSQAMATVSADLGDLAVNIAGRTGASISIFALLEAASARPRVWDLLNWNVPSGDLGEIEKAADAATDELVGLFRSMPGEYGRLLRSGAAINKDQLRQGLVNIGVKPGLMDGELIEEPIDTSFIRGMRSVEDFYICNIGSRKALITNYYQVSASGYLSRKLVLLLAGHTLAGDVADCGTHHGVRTLVRSEDHARRLRGRTMAAGGSFEWTVPTDEELDRLVGTEVLLRSPITCAHGGGVCRTCYGELAEFNSDIHAGIYGVLRISEQITQRLLSSKHLLKARPVKLQWPEEFAGAFSVERTSVVSESRVVEVYVRLDDVEEVENEDRRGISVFEYKLSGKAGRIRITTPIPLYLVEEIWEDAETDNGELVLRPTPETAIFQAPVTNTDLAQALHEIFGLIGRDENTCLHTTYSRLLELLERSALETPSIHAEMIIRALVRSAEDAMRRPDFTTGPDEPTYVILKLSQAILTSPSVSNSLGFERIKAQLSSPDIFKKKDKGPLDALFGA